jgi:hypothetical protein
MKERLQELTRRAWAWFMSILLYSEPDERIP